MGKATNRTANALRHTPSSAKNTIKGNTWADGIPKNREERRALKRLEKRNKK